MIPQWAIQWIEVPITVKTTGAYTALDVVGGTLSCVVPQVKGGCWIYATRFIDDATQAAAGTLYVYDSAPSTIADDAAFSGVTEADWLKCIGKIAIATTDYDTSGTEADFAIVYGCGGTATNSFVHAENLADGKLYFRFVPSGTPNFGADANALTIYVALYVA